MFLSGFSAGKIFFTFTSNFILEEHNIYFPAHLFHNYAILFTLLLSSNIFLHLFTYILRNPLF